MTIQDVSRFKLGKKPYKDHPKTFRAASLLVGAPLTIAPSTLDWFKGGPNSGVMANDQYGDCTIAAAAHLIQTWTGNNGATVTLTDRTIVDTYFQLSGGEDSGLVMLDVLEHWRKTGIGGHKILGYALANQNDLVELKQCEILCGGLYLGLDMPRAWQWMDVWDAVDGPDGEPGTWGGHATNKCAFGDEEVGTLFTWGYSQPITWRAVQKYGVEPWAVLSPDWTESGRAPNGFLQAALETRIAAL